MPEPKYIKHQITNLLAIHKIITVHYHEFRKDYRFEGERHDFWELVYVDRGEVRVTAGKKQVVLGQGSAVFHKPNEFHAIAASGKSTPNVFIITFVCRSKAMDFFKGQICSFNATQRAMAAELMREARATFDISRFNPGMEKLTLLPDAPPGGQQLVRLGLERLLIETLRSQTGNRDTEGPFMSRQLHENHVVRQILDILNSECGGEVSIEALSRKLNYGKTYLYTTFKNATGQGILQYYNYQKIARAKSLIRQQDYNITQISVLLGYASPQYFSRAFRRATGMTPSEYAKSIMV